MAGSSRSPSEGPQIDVRDRQESDDTSAREATDAERELDPIDPRVADARVELTDTTVERLGAKFAVKEIADEAIAFEGNFAAAEGTELALVVPGESISIYSDKGRIARTKLQPPAPPEALPFETEEPPAVTARLVRDGTLQLMTFERHEEEGQAATFTLNVYKVIGSFVARIFSTPIVQSRGDGMEKVAHVDFLKGRHHRMIRVRRAGAGASADARLFRWNKWEGMFREPGRPPTAPGQPKRTAPPDPPGNVSDSEFEPGQRHRRPYRMGKHGVTERTQRTRRKAGPFSNPQHRSI